MQLQCILILEPKMPTNTLHVLRYKRNVSQSSTKEPLHLTWPTYIRPCMSHFGEKIKRYKIWIPIDLDRTYQRYLFLSWVNFEILKLPSERT